MTDNQYLWMGITVDGICFLTAIYLVTVGNWRERRKEKLMETDIPEDQLYECEM